MNSRTSEVLYLSIVFIFLSLTDGSLAKNTPFQGREILHKELSQNQINLGYKFARQVLFGELHLEQTLNGIYKIKDVYCGTVLDESEVVGLGPFEIPDASVINAEHTWPQSKFNQTVPAEVQKSDLHGLYPVVTFANSSRGNLPFAEVDDVTTEPPCRGVSRGTVYGQGNKIFFEPPRQHKGNVARALFYFSVRYKLHIDPVQESFLRAWHIQDPVDAFEKSRNDMIFAYQNNRNPFIDHPEWVDEIHDF